MPVGDSITAGYTDNPNWTHPFAYGYRMALYDLLTAAYPAGTFTFVGQSAEPWNAIFGDPATNPATSQRLRDLGADKHRGYGGAYVNQLSLVSWAAADAPDIVMLMAGINNLSPGSTAEPTGTEGQLRSAVGGLLAARPGVRVIIAQITPYLTVTPALNAYNAWIRDVYVPELQAAGHNVSTVDMYGAMLDGAATPQASMFSNAYNHPNAASYHRMASAWMQALVPHIAAVRAA